MKGYCHNCGEVMDEVEYTQFGMCVKCFTARKDAPLINIKHNRLRIRKGNIDYYYACNTLVWNYWLNRYYPNAGLTMIVEHLNNGFKLKLT